MDFSTVDLKRDAAAGIDVTILDVRTGKPFLGDDGLEIVIKIQGMDSDKWQDTAKGIGERNTAKYKRRPVPPEVTESDLKEVLAVCTISWTNNFGLSGDDVLECTFDNAVELYELPNAIAEQLITAGTSRNYEKKS